MVFIDELDVEHDAVGCEGFAERETDNDALGANFFADAFVSRELDEELRSTVVTFCISTEMIFAVGEEMELAGDMPLSL